MLHQLRIYLRELENESFEIKIKDEITVASMREYIKTWLINYLVTITNTDKQEAVTIFMPPPTQQKQYSKDASKKNKVSEFPSQ